MRRRHASDTSGRGFLRYDARDLAGLGESFETVVDCGLFHIFAGDDRTAFAASLRSVVAPGGHYFMLCCSDREPTEGWVRMHRVTRDEIRATFTDGWRIDSLDPATIEITTDRGGIRAWLCSLTRI